MALKNYGHKPGTPNPIMEQEESAILLDVKRAKSSSNNSQTLGRNGEIALIDFLNRYLPNTLKAVSGHFITTNNDLSPQIDIMILDSRYPLLSHNLDGSVLAMAHSVIDTIEVKTNLRTKDIKSISSNAQTIMHLVKNEGIIGDYPKFGMIKTSAVAYHCEQRLKTIEKTYIGSRNTNECSVDITILRYPQKDLELKSGIGGTLHMEPVEEENIPLIPDNITIKNGSFFMSISSHTPLSDFYYTLVQDSYYSLGERNFSLVDIGNHYNKYMNWTTSSFGDF